MTHVHQGHFTSYDLEFTLNTRRLTQWLISSAGVVKAIESFYRIDSDTAFERQRSRMPINDVITVHALKNHPCHSLDSRNWQVNTGLVTLTSGFTEWHEAGWEKRQLRHHHRQPVEAGTTKHAG